MPDLPTTKELGLPSVVMESWYGVFLPAGTPAPIRDRLEKALLAVVATPLVKQRFAELGMHGTLGHEAFRDAAEEGFRAMARDDHDSSGSPGSEATPVIALC